MSAASHPAKVVRDALALRDTKPGYNQENASNKNAVLIFIYNILGL